MREAIRHSALTRVLARGLAATHAVGPRGLPLLPEVLEEAAAKDARLTDFGDRSYEDGLDVLCRSLREDAALSTFGHLQMGAQVVGALATRLERVDLAKRDPGIFRRPLNRPLVIMGLPRSGTTFLHRLLCLADDARPLRLYELQRPVQKRGIDLRRLQTRGQVAILKAIAPALDAKHFVDAEGPEECMFLFDSSFVSMSFWTLAPVYGYARWYLDQDKRGPYREYREHLQIFQAEDPSLRLTLKAPAHTGCIEALLAAIPEALLVQTHRDPLAVMPSLNSLFHTFHSVLADVVDPGRTAVANLELIGRSIDRNLEARARHADRILDVHYDDLVADPKAVVRSVHERYGLGWSAGFEERLDRYLAENPQDRHGRHTYRADESGLTDDVIARRFGEYRARFVERRSA
jgi:hypothetical protein